MEPEPEVDLQPELEPEPELFKDILPSEDKDIDGLELAGYYEKEAMPLQENTVLGADSMRENELEENDKYLLTPEEEKAFDLDIPDCKSTSGSGSIPNSGAGNSSSPLSAPSSGSKPSSVGAISSRASVTSGASGSNSGCKFTSGSGSA